MGTTAKIILIMGVAGSGKSTIGRRTAARLGWPYFEADDFHSNANKAKMARGEPLNDDDRAPWLAALRTKIDEVRAAASCAVFTCSALKTTYRETLVGGVPEARLVYLKGDAATLHARLSQRQKHFMKADMLQSQLAALEPPADALTVEITLSPDEIVQQIVYSLT